MLNILRLSGEDNIVVEIMIAKNMMEENLIDGDIVF